MLRKIWIALGAVALITGVYVTAFAVEEVQKPVAGDGPRGVAAEAATWTVCSSGCDFTSIQAAVDTASDGGLIELGAETFYANVVVPDAKGLTIRGAGRTDTVVDGRAIDAVFRSGDSVLRLENMTIRNGGNDGVLGRRLAIENCLVKGNSRWPGRGISGNDIVITQSVISDHSWSGVEVYNVRDNAFLPVGSAKIHESTIANNGQGVYLVDSNATITSSTISDNSQGGGIWAAGWYTGVDIAITNTTISGNSNPGWGGGLHVVQYYGEIGYYGPFTGAAYVTISQSTIAGNTGISLSDGPLGVWLYCYPDCGLFPPSLSVYGSVFAFNSCAGFDPVGDSNSFFSDESIGLSCGGSSYRQLLTGFDPVLRDNGGPTKTHALLPGSSAIDADDDCPPTDQRGVARPQDGDGDGVAWCDAGAFEFVGLVVDVDIKPDSYSNSINPFAGGVIPVAILGSDTFDVADVDVATLAFGPSGAPIAHREGHLHDVNYDGIMDLMAHFRTQDTAIACGDGRHRLHRDGGLPARRASFAMDEGRAAGGRASG
jgi:hypothetical protein